MAAAVVAVDGTVDAVEAQHSSPAAVGYCCWHTFSWSSSGNEPVLLEDMPFALLLLCSLWDSVLQDWNESKVRLSFRN